MIYSVFHQKWESGYGSYLNCYCLDHLKIYNKVKEDCVLKKYINCICLWLSTHYKHTWNRVDVLFRNNPAQGCPLCSHLLSLPLSVSLLFPNVGIHMRCLLIFHRFWFGWVHRVFQSRYILTVRTLFHTGGSLFNADLLCEEACGRRMCV